MKHAIIDFESFYDKELSVVNMGVPNYVEKSYAYCVSVVVDGEAYCGKITEMGPMICQLAADPTVIPVAANANFDEGWSNRYYDEFQNPWYCILDHGAFCQYPRNVAGLAGVVLGEKVDKTIRDAMRGRHWDAKGLEVTGHEGRVLTAQEQADVLQYCLNDGMKEAQILEKLLAESPMSSFEQKVAAHTRMINRRGILVNTDLVQADKTKLEEMKFAALKAIPWHEDGAPLSYPELKKYCQAKNIPVPPSLAKTNEETTDLMTESPELAEIIGAMRRYRRANTMIEKTKTLMERVTPDGILPLDILYCGAAHTRRWSSKGFNVQNLDKEPFDTGNGTVWSRNWLIPRPGHKFLILDYAQVEPRCLNWLVGNTELLDAMRAGYSYYEAYAKMARGWSGAPGTIKAEYGKKKYTLLKNECLGLGYGMGAPKFVSYAAQNGNEISLDDAKAVVTAFRKGNPKVTQFWRKMDNLIANAARDKSKHLALEMPAGDLLQHFTVRARLGGYESYTTKGDFGFQSHQDKLWGGTLTENVTQRFARDLLANAVLNLEEAGLRVLFHAHDEVILEVPDAGKEKAKEEAIRIMTTSPEWAEGLPLAVEGGFAEAYTK